jgi:hypothetical protein
MLKLLRELEEIAMFAYTMAITYPFHTFAGAIVLLAVVCVLRNPRISDYR